jgi:hypothetical protein
MARPPERQVTINDHLDTLQNKACAAVFKDVYRVVISNKNRDDNYLRRQKNRVQKWMEEEREAYEKQASEWALHLINGMQARFMLLQSSAVRSEVKELEDSLEEFVLSELEKYQRQLKQTKAKTTNLLNKIDHDMYEKHEEMLQSDVSKLLSTFRKLEIYEVRVENSRPDVMRGSRTLIRMKNTMAPLKSVEVKVEDKTRELEEDNKNIRSPSVEIISVSEVLKRKYQEIS